MGDMSTYIQLKCHPKPGFMALPHPLQEAGFTALHMAARHGHVAVVRFLLEAGAKLDCRDQMGANVLHTAAEHGQVPIRLDGDGEGVVMG